MKEKFEIRRCRGMLTNKSFPEIVSYTSQDNRGWRLPDATYNHGYAINKYDSRLLAEFEAVKIERACNMFNKFLNAIHRAKSEIYKLDSHENPVYKLLCELRDEAIEPYIPRVIAYGTQDREDCGTQWWLFPPELTDSECIDILNHAGFDPQYYYGGVGRLFHNEMRIKRTKTRVLVTQFFGLDV